MKNFVAAALAAATVFGQERHFMEGAGENGTTGQFVRLSATETVDVLGNYDNADSLVKWQIKAQGVFYEDSGLEKVRLTHELTADLFATDVVLFEIAFRPDSEPARTDTATIGEDYVQCQMSQSTSDSAFWSASVSEGFYICKENFDSPSDVCKGVAIANDDANYTQVPESASDWVTPFVDDDPKDFWCTKKNTVVGDDLNPYECSALKCVIERVQDTGDTENDFAIDAAAGATDKLLIQPGRAKLYINKTSFNYPLRNDITGTQLEITIRGGAAQLLTTVAAGAIALAALAF